MIENNKLYIAKGKNPIYLIPKMANRHGLIAGATGTGKTITLKVLAESFSSIGVPVFLADIKGDLSGMCEKGIDSSSMQERIKKLELNSFTYQSFPTQFWDIFGEKGTPIRITVSDLGPVLISRLLNLTDVQEGVLAIVFKVADHAGYLIDDLKDLRSMLNYVNEHKNELTVQYGNVSSASVGAISRALLKLEDEGANDFFGLPAFDIRDWIKTSIEGKGMINILDSTKLIQSPLLYSTFLLWMLSELFEALPEVGDLEKPRMIFFFDEAHLLFQDAPKSLVQKVVQIVKLIRSKGVGIYFISQSPSDIPNEVLAQLSNRVIHALRAYTPSEQKAVKVAAQTFRQNPDFKVENIIGELKVGEALVSFLDEEGTPGIVDRASILPPLSLMGPVDDQKMKQMIVSSELDLKYRQSLDRESAYELISQETVVEQPKEKETKKEKKTTQKKTVLEKTINSATSSMSRSVSTSIAKSLTGGKTTSPQKMIQRAATNALGTLIREGTKEITRGLFGTRK